MRGEFWKVVETDNYGRDYPNESWATPYSFIKESDAQKVADTLNGILDRDGRGPRYIKVVKDDYKLQPGFEP